MRFLLLFILLVSTSLFADETKELERLFNIDRFHTYLQRWAETLKGRGQVQAVEAVEKLKPNEIADLNIDPKRLADPTEYDGIIFELVTKRKPKLKVKKADLAWDYNFYKRKLAEAYKLGPSALKPGEVDELELDKEGKRYSLNTTRTGDLLLNVDGYVSGRTTRAVFWEASRSGRPIELHVGRASDFRTNLAERGGKIIGLVKTVERNYNPIYVIELPNQEGYRYAITEISGADRLKHFAIQTELVLWDKSLKPPKLELFGDPVRNLLNEEMVLRKVLENTPPADRVIIGQKGAIERTLENFGKREAILSLAKKHFKDVAKLLEPSQLTLLEKALKDPEVLSPHRRDVLSHIEKMYEAVEALFEKHKLPGLLKFTEFSFDRGMYEFSDYLLKDAHGKTVRWRVFSNSWGDEVLPIARALKATGTKDVVYIGTAGAFPQSGLKVGDLVLPKGAMDQAGKVSVIRASALKPEGIKEIGSVVNVASPFEETTNWLARVRKTSQVVEIETAYLASTFNSKSDRLSPYLLISDVVGVEGETLAEASSSSRVRAQSSVISAVLTESKISGVATASLDGHDKLASWLDELVPSRDVLSRFQLLRLAKAEKVSSKVELARLVKLQESFTTERLLGVLNQSGKRLLSILSKSKGMPKVSIDREFLEGRWNPAMQPVSIHLQVGTKKAEEELLAVIASLVEEDKQYAKLLNVTVSREAPPKEFVRLTKLPSAEASLLVELYKDSAMGFGGLAATETRTGVMKFVQVAPVRDGRAVATIQCHDVFRKLSTLKP